jgi:FtsP/CotA-like multicopper oxidase with cupredoxin domain
MQWCLSIHLHHCLNVESAGKTYRFRISNVGLTTSINFRIQGHTMKLVEVEGSHTLQNTYSSLDIHLGQTYSVLVTANQPVKDYYVVVSTRFTRRVLTTTSILHYSNSRIGVSGPAPPGPTLDITSSVFQARTIRYSFVSLILSHLLSKPSIIIDIFMYM